MIDDISTTLNDDRYCSMMTDYVRHCSTTIRLRSTLFDDDPTTFDDVRRYSDYVQRCSTIFRIRSTIFDDIPTTFDDVRRYPDYIRDVRRHPDYIRRCSTIFRLRWTLFQLCSTMSVFGHCRALLCRASSITPCKYI